MLEMSSLYTSVLETAIIWGVVLEIWSETDRIFCILGHFLLFYPLTTSWKIVNCYFSFCAIFCPLPFNHPNCPKNKNKNRYLHFTHVHQKFWSDDVWFLRYGMWQTEKNGQMDGQKKWHIDVGASPIKSSHKANHKTFLH